MKRTMNVCVPRHFTSTSHKCRSEYLQFVCTPFCKCANVQLQQLPGPRRFVINCRTKSLHLVTTTQGLPWKIICIICMIVIQKLYAWLCIDFRYQKWKCKHTWLCVCVSISMQVKNQIWLELQNLFGHQWWHYVNAKAISYVLWYYVTILTDRKSILNAA